VEFRRLAISAWRLAISAWSPEIFPVSAVPRPRKRNIISTSLAGGPDPAHHGVRHMMKMVCGRYWFSHAGVVAAKSESCCLEGTQSRRKSAGIFERNDSGMSPRQCQF